MAIFGVDGAFDNADMGYRTFFKEQVSSMKPYEDSFVRWNNKGSDSKKEEKAARVLLNVDLLNDGATDKDLLITALSA